MTITAESLQKVGQTVNEHDVRVNNNRQIHATVFHAAGADTAPPKSIVIIAGAMGVTQNKYAKFAQFLSEQGHTAITFDYFGTGKSLQTHLKKCNADILSWGEQDCEAIINFAHEHYPGIPLQWMGHSVGGQLLGIIRNTNKLSHAITLSAGTGYWRYNSAKTRRSILLMWYVIAPVALKLCGYFPGNKLKIVGDLPANVVWQWRRWCLVKDYAAEAEGPEIRQRYADVDIPITSLSFEDDEMLSAKNIHDLHQLFNQDRVTMLRIYPKEIGEKFIGHLGWFRDKFKQSLWQGEILPRLDGNSRHTYR